MNPEVVVSTTTIRQCDICHSAYPHTTLYFYTDEESGELTSLCKTCESSRKRMEDNMEVEERLRKLDMKTLALLDAIIDRPDHRNVVHMAEMWQTACQVFGGPEGIMKRYMATYMMSDPGSSTRKQILDSIVKIGQHESVTSAASLPLDMMSDDDLEELHQEQLKRITLHEPDFSVKDSTADDDEDAA